MTANYCEGLDHGFFRIDMSDTTGANGQSIKNAVNRMVIILIKKNIRFTRNGGENLAKCQTLIGNTVKTQEYLYSLSLCSRCIELHMSKLL